nr:FAD-dependent oxidoreductase [Candidatus Sigynarchaeum springense]
WLPELFSGVKNVDKIIMRDSKWYANRNITLHVETRISRIDVKRKEVITEKGIIHPFDKVCVCTGAFNFVPPIKNATLEGVFTLRTIDDALAIKAFIQGKKKAVCIGGGLLGLEAARNLVKAGIHVTVVEYFPRLLPKQLCNTSADILKEKINNMGIQTILGANVAEILGDGRVTAIKLTDGTTVDANIILISTGIKAKLDALKGSGLKVNKGLVIDDHMRVLMEDGTPSDSIFAAGDVVEFQGRGWGIIPAALEQAAVASKMIAGVQTDPYTPTVPSNKLKIMDFDLMSTGTAILDDTDENCKVFISKDELKGVFKKFVLRDGKLIGAILLEAKDDEGFVTKNMNKEISEGEVQKHISIKK